MEGSERKSIGGYKQRITGINGGRIAETPNKLFVSFYRYRKKQRVLRINEYNINRACNFNEQILSIRYTSPRN